MAPLNRASLTVQPSLTRRANKLGRYRALKRTAKVRPSLCDEESVLFAQNVGKDKASYFRLLRQAQIEAFKTRS
jgi:hypothetical protein